MTQLSDEDRQRWLCVRDDYVAARKLAAACLGADAGDDVVEAATRTMLEHFRASVAPSNAPAVTMPQAPASDVLASVEKCPEKDCGGAIWDNRAAKADGTIPKNRPDLKCKECGWTQWPAKKAGAGK